MAGFIFGIFTLLAGIIAGIFLIGFKKTIQEDDVVVDDMGRKVRVPKTKEVRPGRRIGWISITAGIILGFVFTFLGCFASVTTGNTGVVTTFGKVENYTLEAGFHLKAPWHKVVEMDNRVQKTTVELNCFSSDIQEVSMRYTLNYQIDKANAQEIYKTIGVNYYATIIEPNIAEAVKVATAKYTAEQLVQTRSDLAKDIEELLSNSLSKYNIKLASTAIEDMDFTDAFTNAVEAKQVAEQKKKQAEIEQAQALAQAENDKKIAMTNAEAASEVARIQAEADKIVAEIAADSAEYQGKKEAAIALQRLASINGWTVVTNEETGIHELYKASGEKVTAEELEKGAKRLIEYYYTESWDGQLPDTVIGDDSGILIGIGGNN
jgi:regulator of protease activity HflC (stomatin/prohibitin superfamily)